MRRILVLTLLSLLAVVPIGVGSPTEGSSADFYDLGPTVWTTTKKFNAGERACVLAVGDHQERVTLEVNVYDAKGILVASDKTANLLVGDFVGVIWYPPRAGEYRIEVKNPGSRVNKCYIAVR
jgi:hypothetical protein